MSSPAISGNGFVYVGTTDNKTLCLNETSGTVVWSSSTDAPVTSSPAIFDDHVIVGTTGSTVYCFGPLFSDVAVAAITPSNTVVMEGLGINIFVTVGNVERNRLYYQRIWWHDSYRVTNAYHIKRRI
jgi:outer membrane protein assembly factor BamB